MRVKFAVAAALMAGLPGVSLALGLGDIQLKSTLNAPLNAEIELIGATPEELAGLRAQLASRDTFERAGLDYPPFLSGIQVRLARSADNRPVIELRSTQPITEPFATLLVEVTYPRGRQVREYTVLLDPPVFAPPAASAPAPVAAPATGEGQRSGEVVREPAPTPVAAASPAPAVSQPARPASAAAPGSTYEVRRGDTLSRIAAGLVGPGLAEQSRAMIAIYRGNPEAFDGNINLLRSGAVLRLPDADTLAGFDAAAALAEVRRQSASWQSSRAGADGGAQDARLRLVPPGEAPAGTAGSDGGAGTAALQQRVAELESQLAEARRLLELRNAELARLQGGQATPAEAPATDEPSATATDEAPEAAADAGSMPATEAPAAAETPAPAPATTPTEPATADEGILGLLKTFWYIPAALLALVLALLGVRAARRRREEALDASLGLGTLTQPALRETSNDTLPLRKPNIGDGDGFVVEESGSHERPAFAGGPARAPQRVEVDEPLPDVPLVEETAALEQGDPLAEADFHMAYGLYDQAADLVRLAIQREPGRRDLKLKLLEVFFVWGNREQFLQTARDLAATRDQAEPGEWEKVVIMGKQLAPDDALFSQAAPTGVGPAEVDLNLEGGQNRVDFDLLGEPEAGLGQASETGVDLDLGAALGDSDPTGNGEALSIDPGALDFVLDDPARGGDGHTATTRQMQMAEPGLRDTVESPTLERARQESEGPTVEQPGLPVGETIRQKLDVVSSKFGSADQTAELALDDLGLDLGSLEDTGHQAGLDDSQISKGLESTDLGSSADAPTLLAGLDDESRQLIDEARGGAEMPTMLAPSPGTQGGETGTWMFDDKDFARAIEEMGRSDGSPTMAMPSVPDLLQDGSPTSQMRALAGEGEGLDLELDSLAATGRNEAPSAVEPALDLDVGAPDPAATGSFGETARFQSLDGALPELEPATMSEVGTKLDLARAYMDMGDPEGARSILNEVLQEGSSNQKQEAQRLLDSMPG